MVPHSVHDHIVTNCLSTIFDVIAQRREKTRLRRLILHSDNVRLYQAWMRTEYLTANRDKSYQNSQYMPDLCFCYFFLFQKLKNQLRKVQFNNDEEMLDALDHAIVCLAKENFQNCFDDWLSRMQKFIDVGEEYFEKINRHCYLKILCKSWRKSFPSPPCNSERE